MVRRLYQSDAWSASSSAPDPFRSPPEPQFFGKDFSDRRSKRSYRRAADELLDHLVQILENNFFLADQLFDGKPQVQGKGTERPLNNLELVLGQ